MSGCSQITPGSILRPQGHFSAKLVLIHVPTTALQMFLHDIRHGAQLMWSASCSSVLSEANLLTWSFTNKISSLAEYLDLILGGGARHTPPPLHEQLSRAVSL